MENKEVIDYITQLPQKEVFDKLDTDLQNAYLFQAIETLTYFYSPSVKANLNARVVALYTLYLINNESDGYSKFNDNNIHSYSVKDVSVTFKEGKNGSYIPDFIKGLLDMLNPDLNKHSGGRLGRLI